MRPTLHIPSAAKAAFTPFPHAALYALMLAKARQAPAPPRPTLPTSAPRLRNVRMLDVAMDHMIFVGWPKVKAELLALHGVH